MVDKTLWRDIIGNLVAGIVVLSFCALGYTQLFIQAMLGVTATVSETWESTLGGLASFALGYLVKAAENKAVQAITSTKLTNNDVEQVVEQTTS